MFVNVFWVVSFFVMIGLGQLTGKSLTPVFDKWAFKANCLNNRGLASEQHSECKKALEEDRPVRPISIPKNPRAI